MRVGITGHRGLSAATEEAVRGEMQALLRQYEPAELCGVSCLADGPDAWFAEIVLLLGGRIEAVVPAEGYRSGLPDDHRATYDGLLGRAMKVHRTGARESCPEAHMAGSEILVGLVDRLLAVWDGKAARGFGGTADVVVHARRTGVPVDVIWPAGATRD
ncbi:hypothetical protein OEIGOIKO_03690 [Streptomyces chrestomyceticus JCM 4735]|uniref:Uncharacterized protein n=1 Tax=Streptomyces chrestomyceticus JCM 4735 TaxID=1306181 RepID=A0A7U9KV30_9ACTN|nr:hypothetical protein [Streptomyces chrestomyceticus]GCD35939.1 hypothetical protein OEIGOIKO_03690 [Streptomyces chrestomyceticus JCM 4735]